MTDQQALQGAYNLMMIEHRLQGACLLGVLCGLSLEDFNAACTKQYLYVSIIMKDTKNKILELKKSPTGESKI